MDEKENLKENSEDNKEVKRKSSDMSKKILNFFLAIIIITTVGVGSVIYYHLYKYSIEEISSEDDSEEVSTVAEIIDTAIDASNSSTTDSENTTVSANATISTSDADSRKVLNEELIVLYDGLVLDTSEMKVVSLKYIDNSSSNKEDYVITYYNYENFAYVKSSLGTISNQILDGLVKIDNVEKVAISENYDAIPQEIQVVNSIPAVVLDNNSDFSEYDTKKTLICDLDADGTNEYIIILANKTTGESKIVLVESTGFVKATIAYMEKSGWETITSGGYYLSYMNIELLDIDQDGVMEILFEVPTTSSTPSEISLLKYNNGELTGTFDLKCTLVSETTE